MSSDGAPIAVGVLMMLAGTWVVLRTVRRPAGGRNLVDVILGTNGGASSTSSTPAPATPAPSAPRQPVMHAPTPNAKGRTVGGRAGA